MTPSGPSEHPFSDETNDHPVGILANRSIPLFEEPFAFGDCIGATQYFGVAFEGEPPTTVDLADDCTAPLLDIDDFLRALGGNDRNGPIVVGEGDGDHVRSAVCAQGRERAEMPFREEPEVIGGEVVGGARHAHGGYRPW
jgi:hypothetical protein